MLLNHCTRYWYGNITEAENSSQNSWIKVFNSIHGYRVGTEGNEGNFYGWILTVCKNECTDNFRKKRRVNVGDYIANPDYDPFTEEGRQKPKYIDRNVPFDAPEEHGDEEAQPGIPYESSDQRGRPK